MAWWVSLAVAVGNAFIDRATNGNAPDFYADSNGNLSIVSSDFRIDATSDGKVYSSSRSRQKRSGAGQSTRPYWYPKQQDENTPSYERFPDIHHGGTQIMHGYQFGLNGRLDRKSLCDGTHGID